MSEDLSITRIDLMRHIGRELGYAREPSFWDERQNADVDDILARAERMFYNPPILPGEAQSHRWSWLRPIFTISTVANQGNYDLPDEFGGISGELFYGKDLVGHGRLVRVGEQWILNERQGNDGITGYPRYYAVVPLASDGEHHQKFALLLEPIPDDQYELTGQYRVNPHHMQDSKPYPLGGQPHAETLIAAALAACESSLQGTIGPRKLEFMERLAASVSHDRMEMSPSNLGYCGDGMYEPARRTRALLVTYEGALPD